MAGSAHLRSSNNGRGRATLDLDAPDESVPAADDGLNDPLAENAPQIVHVRSNEALAHRDPAPDGFYNLGVSNEPSRILREKAQDRERLASQLDLFAVLPQSFVVEVQSERRE